MTVRPEEDFGKYVFRLTPEVGSGLVPYDLDEFNVVFKGEQDIIDIFEVMDTDDVIQINIRGLRVGVVTVDVCDKVDASIIIGSLKVSVVANEPPDPVDPPDPETEP